MVNKTICQNCGRLVNLAPNICVLCGSNLDESPRVLFVQPKRFNKITLDGREIYEPKYSIAA